MGYLGQFLRSNSIDNNKIKSQMFFFSKESLKHVVLQSKCGITASHGDLKIKFNNNDITTFKNFSPLLCVYKKGNCKMISNNGKSEWNSEKFKKEISVTGNALMTLCLLELSDYYKAFSDIDSKKFALSTYFYALAKKQLDFAASNLRNDQGVFVDKKNISDTLSEKIKFEEKNKKFNYYDQALYMSAFYKTNDETYINFSLDILNMFKRFKDEIYNLSYNELLKLSLSLNIFYEYSDNEEGKNLLLDIFDLCMERHGEENEKDKELKLENEAMFLINCCSLYKITDIYKFKAFCEESNDKLVELYSPESGIFLNSFDKKEVQISSTDIILYILALMLYSDLDEHLSDDTSIIMDVYKNECLASKIISTWPDSPDLNDAERYKNFSRKAEDVLDEDNFRYNKAFTLSNDDMDLAPIFSKYTVYNRKKGSFSGVTHSYDSTKNMLIDFISIKFFKK